MNHNKGKSPLYIFLHIPKCAGTTLTYHLEQNFPKEELMPLYAFKFYNHASEQFENINHPENIKSHLLNLSEEKKERIRFVYGHQVYYGIHEYFSKPFRYVTFLRDPVRRTVSLYYHYKSRYDKNLPVPHWRKNIPPGLSFEEWFNAKTQPHNYMTHFFLTGHGQSRKIPVSQEDLAIAKSRLNQMFFVGITERAKNDFLYLYDLFGIRNFFEDQNITTQRDTDLDPVVSREIVSKTNVDQELYDFALILNHKQRTEIPDYRLRVVKTRIKRLIAPLFPVRRDIRKFHTDYLCYIAGAMNKDSPRILILGMAKSGTTALFSKVQKSMPSSALTIFEPREFDPQWLKSVKPLLVKVIFQTNLDIHYEAFDPIPKKVLIVRDPRDRIVSSLLYSSITIYHKQPDRFIEFLNLIKKKEQDPFSISFKSLFQFRWIPDEDKKPAKTIEKYILFSRQHPEYFLFKYEHLIDGKIKPLEQYLGIPLKGSADVDGTYNRVVRTKSYGDWKNWFTQEDVEYFKPRFEKYMKHFGYNDEWELSPEPKISPEYGSKYVERIISELTEDSVANNSAEQTQLMEQKDFKE